MKVETTSLPIGPVLEDYGADLSRCGHGRWSPMRCPFHDDRNASASVHLGINRFVCFAGCTDRPEDTIGLIAHVEGLGFRAALSEAQRITGVEHGTVRGGSRPSASVFDQPWD